MNSNFLTTQPTDNFTLIKVINEKLDTNIAPELKSELVLVVGNGEKNILLDISKCESCDSSGLSAILVANRLCKNSCGNFILFGIQDSVKKLMEISQLDSVLNIAENNEDALSLLEELSFEFTVSKNEEFNKL
ncbi:MAG: STAS domain-containing protein [Marinifilaceae bacterium]|jgi:anti-anti-sigma factor|nr:STAS domain-containing protein [Marinifilaceae bacterium]